VAAGLPGVGVKVAASVLNFSPLNMRALVVDTHVHRVAGRLGLVPASYDTAHAYRALMDMVPDSLDGRGPVRAALADEGPGPTALLASCAAMRGLRAEVDMPAHRC
jgi:adenine-specific DNA glycosylase